MRNNWQTKKLGDICDLLNGFAFKSIDYIPLSNTMNFRMSQIKPDGTIDLNNNPKYLPDSYAEIYKNYLLKNGDIVIAMTDLATETKILGVPTIVETDGKNLLLNQRVGKLYKIDERIIYLPFLRHALTTPQVNKYYKSLGRGGVQINISKNNILNVQINLPILSEQKRIVMVLDKVFEKIEKAKENTRKNLQNSRELSESYLQKLFANMGKDWENKKLNKISENLDNKRIPITKNVRSSGNYPYYGASGIVDYVSEYIFDNNLLLVSEDGANLLARTYPIAFSISGKTWVNNHAHVLKFEKIESQRFVEYYLNSIKLNPYVSGMAQPKLNQKMLNSIPIPYPPISEQKSIVLKLNKLSEETQKLEAIYKQKLADLEELKKSVLKKAFNGEL